MSRYEEQGAQETITACLSAIRHPSTLPQFFRSCITGTGVYFRAGDVIDLERSELVQVISYSRKMAMKMTGASLFLGLLVAVSLIGTCKAAEPWTPDDFDWSLMKVAPQDQWTGLYINLTEVPQPMVHEQALLFAQGRPGQLGEHQVIFVPFLLGLAWQAIQIGVAIGSIATAIQGCDTSGK